MKSFSQLLDRLTYTPARNAKLMLMRNYFLSTPDPDRGYALAALTDGLPVDFPLRRTPWAQAYDRILGKALCKYELLIDEAGHPFVWITSLQTPNRRP